MAFDTSGHIDLVPVFYSGHTKQMLEVHTHVHKTTFTHQRLYPFLKYGHLLKMLLIHVRVMSYRVMSNKGQLEIKIKNQNQKSELCSLLNA